MSDKYLEEIRKHYPKAEWAEGSNQQIVALMSPPINWPCFKCKEIMPEAEVWVNSEWQHNECNLLAKREEI